MEELIIGNQKTGFKLKSYKTQWLDKGGKQRYTHEEMMKQLLKSFWEPLVFSTI